MIEMSLEEYKKEVQYLAENQVDLIFPNPTKHHAVVVLSNILKYSKSSINIYDKDLSGDLLSLNKELSESFIDATNNKKEVNIIIDDKENINSTLFFDLKNNAVNFFLASNEFKNRVSKTLGKKFYFATGDDSIFRLESFDDERKAICSFNNRDYPRTLLKIINKTKNTLKVL